MPTESELLEHALKLPATQRAAMAQQLLESLKCEESDPEAGQMWAEEIERRAVAYDRGDIKSVDAAETIERIRRSINRGKSI